MNSLLRFSLLVIPSVLFPQAQPEKEIPKFLKAKVASASSSHDVLEIFRVNSEFTSRGLKSPLVITEEMVAEVDAMAERGNPRAMYLRSNNIKIANGNKEESSLWLRRAAEAGDRDAMKSLAQSLNSIAGQIPAAMKNGTSSLSVKESIQPNAKRDQLLTEAKEWSGKAYKGLLAAAESGDVDAMAELGTGGIYCEHKWMSSKQSHEWSLKAAERGDSKSAYFYAMFAKRQGRTPDAWKWLIKAAEAGEWDAMVELGEWYMIGDSAQGIAPDKVKSKEWYDKAIVIKGDRGFLEYRAHPYGDPKE